MNPKNIARVYAMPFAAIYSQYVQKVEKKGRNQQEIDEIICWLTGYSKSNLAKALQNKVTLENFYLNAPRINPNRRLITGLICGIRVEDIKEPTTQNMRYLDKLIDELARGKALDKILRTESPEH